MSPAALSTEGAGIGHLRRHGVTRIIRARRSRRLVPLARAAGIAAVLAAFALAPSGNSATTGLVAAYAFNDGAGTTVADASGNGRTGTTANTTWSTTGKYGGALSFNGTSSRVTVADAASLHLTSAMTLEAWINPTTATPGWRDVVYKGDDNYYLSATTNTSRPGGGGIFNGSYGEVFGTANTATNTWTYLAVTYDGATLRFFVNGTQTATLAKTGALKTSTNPLTIGSDAIYGQYFRGLIDDVRVYNIALTQAQVQSDMGTPVAGGSDTQPPGQPGTLGATAISSSRIDLSWGAATDNVAVTGYRIERCQGAGCNNFAQIAAPAGTGTTYSDTSAAASTSYSYRVRATDAAGNLGAYSNTATASTPAATDTQPPGQPGTLGATAISSSRIDLSWGAATDNVAVTGYRIERCQGAAATTSPRKSRHLPRRRDQSRLRRARHTCRCSTCRA